MIALIGLTLQATEGFVPAQVVAGDVTILPIQTPTSFTATARKEVPQSPLRQTSFLSMTEGPSDDALERRKKTTNWCRYRSSLWGSLRLFCYSPRCGLLGPKLHCLIHYGAGAIG